EVTLPPQKRLDISLGPRYEVGESSSAAAARPAGGLRADYDFIATVDREIVRDLEREARMSREAWVRATDVSDLIHGEVLSLRTTVLGTEGTRGKSYTVRVARGGWKLEMELWDLKIKGTDLASYTQRYQELALLCRRMFFEESDKIEKYVGGLPDMIHGSVVASKPKTMQEAIEIATELIDKKIRTFTERETANKRKFENTLRNIQNQQRQHSNKRQNTGRVYTAASSEKKQYGGSKTLCAKCNYHHDGPCAPKCRNCNKIGHLARDCRNTENTNNVNNQRGTGLGQKAACYE
nr:reverse transcriptase domain-containing protein [Tanacetum cinerariifolium]